MFGEWPTADINGSIGAAKQNFSGNFSKTDTNFAWVCIIMVIVVIYSVTEKNL